MAPSPSKEELERRRACTSLILTVNINKETVTNITSTDFPYHYPGEDHAWDISKFRDEFKVQFHYNEDFDCSFSLIGIDASVANAFRRLLISEVPTLAIEEVYINMNTSVIQDEVLAHRLGLIPFKGGEKGLTSFLKWRKKGESSDEFDDYNTVMLRLQVECTHNEKAAAGETDPEKLYHHAFVFARDIEFVPEGDQAKYFSGADAIAPVNPDILIAKMRPGQAIELHMLMCKGIGADHAKFSPVATASYRLMPTITITQPILGADAEKFQACFPEGVIALEKVKRAEAVKGSPYEGYAGKFKAVVKNPMRDTVSRECLRHPEFEGKVKLGRRQDHFIFSIESTGQWKSDNLFLEAVKLLGAKCAKLEQQVINMAR